jgi:hypothetical protein
MSGRLLDDGSERWQCWANPPCESHDRPLDARRNVRLPGPTQTPYRLQSRKRTTAAGRPPASAPEVATAPVASVVTRSQPRGRVSAPRLGGPRRRRFGPWGPAHRHGGAPGAVQRPGWRASVQRLRRDVPRWLDIAFRRPARSLLGPRRRGSLTSRRPRSAPGRSISVRRSAQSGASRPCPLGEPPTYGVFIFQLMRRTYRRGRSEIAHRFLVRYQSCICWQPLLLSEVQRASCCRSDTAEM